MPYFWSIKAVAAGTHAKETLRCRYFSGTAVRSMRPPNGMCCLPRRYEQKSNTSPTLAKLLFGSRACSQWTKRGGNRKRKKRKPIYQHPFSSLNQGNHDPVWPTRAPDPGPKQIATDGKLHQSSSFRTISRAHTKVRYESGNTCINQGEPWSTTLSTCRKSPFSTFPSCLATDPSCLR